MASADRPNRYPLHDRARGLLDNSLKDKNPDTRIHAVQALGLVSPSEPYLSQLEAMLDDKDVPVRLATITSLVDLKNQRTVPTLQKALDSDVPEVSFAAAKALWALDEPSGREALVAVFSGETKTSSGFITKQKRDALRMLHTPQTMFMFAVKEGATFAPVPGLGAGISSLQGMLSDPSVSGRAAAALLLSLDKSPEVLQALQDALGRFGLVRARGRGPRDRPAQRSRVGGGPDSGARRQEGSRTRPRSRGISAAGSDPGHADEASAQANPEEVTPCQPAAPARS